MLREEKLEGMSANYVHQNKKTPCLWMPTSIQYPDLVSAPLSSHTIPYTWTVPHLHRWDLACANQESVKVIGMLQEKGLWAFTMRENEIVRFETSLTWMIQDHGELSLEPQHIFHIHLFLGRFIDWWPSIERPASLLLFVACVDVKVRNMSWALVHILRTVF